MGKKFKKSCFLRGVETKRVAGDFFGYRTIPVLRVLIFEGREDFFSVH